MRRSLLFYSSLLFILLTYFSPAHAAISLSTNAETGTKFEFLANTTSAMYPVTVDPGDGNILRFTIDPSMSAWDRWIEFEVKGSDITVSGNLTEFELTDAQLSSAVISGMSNLQRLNLSKNELIHFSLESATPLEYLNLSYNNIENSPAYLPSLTLENAGAALKTLNISSNPGLECLDMRDLTGLEDLQANDCPDFASMFICLPEESHNCLKYISIRNCALAHFYPVSLPALRSLDLSGNLLLTEYDDEPFSMGYYPELRTLALSNNKGIRSVDVSDCTFLEQLHVDGCMLTQLDITSCPELNTLNISGNRIKSLDLGNNRLISCLYIAENPFTELDMAFLPNISQLDISNTRISRIDLLSSYFLKSFKASETLLEFVDFNGLQAERMTLVDLRNCPNFTYESMAYTVRTLPVARQAWGTNLFLEGSKAEKADIDYVTSDDMKWICDVEGDGSAEYSPLNISFSNAEFKGEKKVGTLERLYPYGGLSLDYDLQVMHAEGGDFVVAQWEPIWFQSIKDASDGIALKGVPVCVYSFPDEGKMFKSVTVNGREIDSQWFIISEDASVSVNFADRLSSISLSVEKGQDMSFRVNTVQNNGTVWIDWGTGSLSQYPGQYAYATGGNELVGSRIEGRSTGNTVTIYGNLAGLDIDGYGDVADLFGLWDNHVSAIDLSNAPDLKILTAYWNPIESIDLSKCPLLEVLDLSYTRIPSLDLSNCPNLMSFRAYSSTDPDDPEFVPLSSVDLSKLPILQELDLKNCRLGAVDISNNTYLRWVNLCGNNLSAINLDSNPEIEELNLMSNNLADINLSQLNELVELNVDGNNLSSLNLAANPNLQVLMVGSNNISSLNLKQNPLLRTLYINDNGLSAEQINDIFYNLPQRVADDDDSGVAQVGWDICLYTGLDSNPNDYSGNDSSIAIYRGWTPSHLGANNGCDVAYLDLIPSEGGSFSVADANGNAFVSGSKVPKWTPLTISVTPNPGYKFVSFSLNNEFAVADSFNFDMPGIYTRVSALFVPESGVNSLTETGVNVRSVSGGVAVSSFSSASPLSVSIFSADGALMAQADVDGNHFFSLAPGFYIVRVGNSSVSVIVK